MVSGAPRRKASVANSRAPLAGVGMTRVRLRFVACGATLCCTLYYYVPYHYVLLGTMYCIVHACTISTVLCTLYRTRSWYCTILCTPYRTLYYTLYCTLYCSTLHYNNTNVVCTSYFALHSVPYCTHCTCTIIYIYIYIYNVIYMYRTALRNQCFCLDWLPTRDAILCIVLYIVLM